MVKRMKLSKHFIKVASITVLSGATILAAGTSVFAGLNATATATDDVSAGTLKLSGSSGTGSVGLTQNISNMAPGDVVNRYVTLANDGSLPAKDLGLAIASSGTASLLADGTGSATNKGLTVAVNSCSVAWNATDGTCSGTQKIEVAATKLNTFSSKQNFGNTPTLAATNGLSYLQLQVTLPDQNETTVNGTLPANTVQGGSVTLNYTFSEAQRVATTTNS